MQVFRWIFRAAGVQRIAHVVKGNRSKNTRSKRWEEKQLLKLKRKPRFHSGVTYILGKPFHYADAASFVFMYDELFRQQIYKFSTVSTRPYIIDAGANIGLSIIYFKRLFPNAKIVAFEPDRYIFDILQENMRSFGLLDVQLINKALWTEETNLKFFSEGSDAGRLNVENEKSNVVEVGTLRLNPYLKQNVDLLKIDIEGAETAVLEDCKEFLPNVNKIFVEYHSFVKTEQTLDKLLRILREAGFRFYLSHIGVESPNALYQINQYMGMDNQLNIFATR